MTFWASLGFQTVGIVAALYGASGLLLGISGRFRRERFVDLGVGVFNHFEITGKIRIDNL